MSDRLFFALWPAPELTAALAARLPVLLHGTDGRPQRQDQWHVTLEFLGSVPAERHAALRAAASRVRAQPVEIVFDQLEHWRKPGVLCLAAARTSAGVGELVVGLRAALRMEGFEPEAREFRPHVTLARKVRRAEAGRVDPPIVWTADRFALVRSVSDPAGSRYEPLHWWNLCVAEAEKPA
jgi:2'-5' RNA ligase